MVPLILWIRSPIVSAAVISAVCPVANGENRRKKISTTYTTFHSCGSLPRPRLWLSSVHSSTQMLTSLHPWFKEDIKVNPFQSSLFINIFINLWIWHLIILFTLHIYMIVFIHGHDNASNYTISLLFQPVVSYVHNDVYIFRIDLMQNHNFQIVLPKPRGEK